MLMKQASSSHILKFRLWAQIAEIVVEAIISPAASNKIVEVVGLPDAPRHSI
jgi:hypothetical protein